MCEGYFKTIDQFEDYLLIIIN